MLSYFVLHALYALYAVEHTKHLMTLTLTTCQKLQAPSMRCPLNRHSNAASAAPQPAQQVPAAAHS